MRYDAAMRATPRLAESLVLASGLFAAAALAWAGLRSWGDPEVLARIELERGSERAAQLMQLAWQQRAAAPGAPLGSEALRGTLDNLQPALAAKLPSPRAQAPTDHAFDALALEAESTSDRATLELAIERFPAAKNRPAALLRAIQMAASDDDPKGMQEAWLRASEDLLPTDARGDVSLFLLCTLAAAPALEPAQLEAAQARLVREWQARRLVLPIPNDRWQVDTEDQGFAVLDPRYAVWSASIETLSPKHAAEANALASRAGRRLRALFTALDTPTLPAADSLWHALDNQPYLARLTPAGELALAPFHANALALAILKEARPGKGFNLEGSGTRSASTVRIADREWPLFQSYLPDLIAAEARHQRNLRLGFGFLFVLTLAGTSLTLTVLVRRRRLDELKSRFIAGVSHDLRTPLASILIMAENLESGRVSAPARQADYHASIRREAARLGRLVDDVLDFSRLERGEAARLSIEETDLASFADQLETDCRERVSAAGAHLAVRRGALAPSASLDVNALHRCVLNLIENALRHSGSDQLELFIGASEGALHIEVADAGVGIPQADRERLFEPFEQGLHQNPAAGGAGLGLSIVRELSRAHGGDAAFVATPRESPFRTRVRITLPLPPDSQKEPACPTAS